MAPSSFVENKMGQAGRPPGSGGGRESLLPFPPLENAGAEEEKGSKKIHPSARVAKHKKRVAHNTRKTAKSQAFLLKKSPSSCQLCHPRQAAFFPAGLQEPRPPLLKCRRDENGPQTRVSAKSFSLFSAPPPSSSFLSSSRAHFRRRKVLSLSPFPFFLSQTRMPATPLVSPGSTN